MQTILVAAGSERSCASLVEVIRAEYGHAAADCATNAAHTRRLLQERGYDIVLVSAPLSDENGLGLSVHAAVDTCSGVILLVKNDSVEEVSERVEKYGVFVVEKPINRTFFLRALRLVEAAGRRMKSLEREKQSLQVKIDEIKLLSRAKTTLMEYLNLTEAQAHRYVERQAMDMRITKREVAESILKTYET